MNSASLLPVYTT